MSQFYQGVTAGGLPPTVPTSFVTDSGTATPAGNVINVVTPGGGTQGIATSAPGSTNIILITVTGTTSTATTIGAQTVTLLTIPMPDNSSMTLDVLIAGFESTLPGAVGSSLTASFIRTGAGVATIVALADDQQNISPSLSAVSYSIIGSGSDILVTVTGQAGVTINWRGISRTVVAP